MSDSVPEPLPMQHRLFGIVRKSDGAQVAAVEARSKEEAEMRVAGLVRALAQAGWEEVEVVHTEGIVARVPTYMESFFRTVVCPKPTH